MVTQQTHTPQKIITFVFTLVDHWGGGGGGAADGQSNSPSALCGESWRERARELYGPPSSLVTSHAAAD